MTLLFSICLFSGFWKCEFEILTGFEDVCLKCAAQSKHHLSYLPDLKEGKVGGLVLCPLTVLHLEILVCFPLLNIFTFLFHVLCLATKSSLRLWTTGMLWVHYGPRLREGGLTAESINVIIIIIIIIWKLMLLEKILAQKR